MSKHRVAHRSNLGRHTAHRMSMLRTMTGQLLEHEGIRTTVTKMKRVKPLVDQMVTLAKQGTQHHRRQAMAFLRREHLVDRIFSTLPERYKERPGGYTTFVRLPSREGDNAPMGYCMMVDGRVHKLYREYMSERKSSNYIEPDLQITDGKQ